MKLIFDTIGVAYSSVAESTEVRLIRPAPDWSSFAGRPPDPTPGTACQISLMAGWRLHETHQKKNHGFATAATLRFRDD
jgi:hypothetical protein